MRKCRYCRQDIPKRKDCTDPYQRAGFCSKDHAVEHESQKALKALEKKKAAERRKAQDQAKRERQKQRERKEKLKSRTDWVSDAQKWKNRVVVAEDKPKGCISCGSHDVTDAGHFFHRGTKYRTARLTLDRRNLNGQCRHCNSFTGGGNQYEYQKGYIARYGQEAFKELEEFKRATDRGEVPELTIDECKQVIKESKERLKQIKSSQ